LERQYVLFLLVSYTLIQIRRAEEEREVNIRNLDEKVKKIGIMKKKVSVEINITGMEKKSLARKEEENNAICIRNFKLQALTIEWSD
jgi:hypothetical protein